MFLSKFTDRTMVGHQRLSYGDEIDDLALVPNDGAKEKVGDYLYYTVVVVAVTVAELLLLLHGIPIPKHTLRSVPPFGHKCCLLLLQCSCSVYAREIISVHTRLSFKTILRCGASA